MLRGLPRAFWVLFAGTLVNRTGGFVLVFLAIYLTEEHGLTVPQAGAVLSLYGLAAITGGPIGGALADRIGRRPTLVASLVAGGTSMLVLGLAPNTTTVVFAAAAAGLLYEMYRPVVSAAVTDLIEPEHRPRAFGLIYWAINLGAAIAPAVGGWIAARSYRLLFAADAATTIAFGIIVWLALPETRPAAAATQHEGGMRVVLRDRAFLILCALTLLFTIVFFQAFGGLQIDLRAHGFSTTTIGWLFAINGALIIVVQPLITGFAAKQPRTRLLAVGSLVVGAGYAMNAWAADSTWLRALSLVVWTLGEIIFVPGSWTLAADMAPPALRGRYQGVFSVAYTGGFAAAPAVGGTVIGFAGAWWLWIGCGIAGAAVAAGFAIFERVTARADPLPADAGARS
jgi:MFS family permease